MIQLFKNVSANCSRITTQEYSTSFNKAIKLLHRDLREPIHNIYGFVRFADEIVDTFHEYDKKELLQEFRRDTFIAIERGISLNPILNSFQETVKKYSIGQDLVTSFFASMESDLEQCTHTSESYDKYIYGSAEVVGLMCLHVFTEGDKEKFDVLKPYAQALGSAFQKVNFLRDLSADYNALQRVYFPGVDFRNFTATQKREIEKDIEADFRKAYQGIIQLPVKARFGVYVAYKYYFSLFRKISRVAPSVILNDRIRIPNFSKFLIILRAGVRSQIGSL